MKFELYSDFDPSTDQQKVIDKLSKGVSDKQASQLLLGGFGNNLRNSKYYQKMNRPTLIMTHNKTLGKKYFNS